MKRRTPKHKGRSRLFQGMGMMGLLVGMMIFMSMGVLAQANGEQTVCCEQTKSGFYCQDVPQSECAENSRALPTSCESTSYCNPGFCFDSSEGTCIDNTPQLVCNANEGIWSAEQPPQCDLGCCILGDQAAFVTLVRCKKLSSHLGLTANFNSGINNEVQCILTASNQEKGACVYDFEFETTCRFSTRAECSEQEGEGAVNGDFHPGKLCSADELLTNCGPTQDTVCVPGKDEVYFVDSCGNAANIYDSSKLNNKEYWTNIKTKTESCNPDGTNGDNANCGNCNYLQGSYCRQTGVGDAGSATYGDNICADLNCESTSNGQSYKHGEGWCIHNDAGKTGTGVNSVGSRFYKHLCINGQEVLEQCADYRQEECLEDIIETSAGTFSQAGCRVNRWQECTVQDNKEACQNTDRRDCIWRADVELFIDDEQGGATRRGEGSCLPLNPPGLKFWEGQESQSICSQGNAHCIVSFEKKLFGSERCESNCHCLEEAWEKDRAQVCLNLGDCGPNVNWVNAKGYTSGYNVTVEKLRSGK